MAGAFYQLMSIWVARHFMRGFSNFHSSFLYSGIEVPAYA
jgi:hypothetical protein